jgi:acyl carrier protein
MDKLELFNALIDVVTPVNSMGAKGQSLDQPIKETGLDSLDMLMMSIYLSDIYGVSEEIAKTMQPTTINDLFVFMEQHATKTPTDLHAALDSVK